MSTARHEFLPGIRDEAPILLVVIPFGLIYGVAALSAGIPASLAQAMSFIVFAGSAQFVMVQLAGAGVESRLLLQTLF